MDRYAAMDSVCALFPTVSWTPLTRPNTHVQDSQRLPEGFERMGYDADTTIYTYRGPDGRMYESEPGSRYGELWPVGEPRPQPSDAEIEVANEAIEEDNRGAVRMMLPFALLVFVFLVLVFKLIN